jgi:hypothetical protein
MWQTIRINFWDESRSPLLLAGIRPVVERLERAGALDRYWLDTHWKQGPHIRLHIDTDPDRFAAVVAPTIEAEVGAYLTAHPSRRHLDEAALRPIHEGLARIEFEDGPLFPLLPDNQISLIPYTERTRFWGSAEAAEIAAEFRAVAAPLLWELIDRAAGTVRRRMQVAAALMVATVGARGRLQKDHMCFRSHIEGFLADNDADGTVRSALGDWYESNESWLGRRIGTVFAMVEGRRPHELYVARWMELVRDYHERFEQAFTAGEARAFNRDDLNQATAEFQPDEVTGGSSEYHRYMYSFPAVTKYSDSARFHAFRYTVNLTYNALVPLGLRPVERYGLCYAITRFGETFWPEKWWQLIANQAGVEPPFIPRDSVRHAH